MEIAGKLDMTMVSSQFITPAFGGIFGGIMAKLHYKCAINLICYTISFMAPAPLAGV